MCELLERDVLFSCWVYDPEIGDTRILRPVLFEYGWNLRMKPKVGSSDKGPTDNPNPRSVLIGTMFIAYIDTLIGGGAAKSSMYLMKKSIHEKILPNVKKVYNGGLWVCTLNSLRTILRVDYRGGNILG